MRIGIVLAELLMVVSPCASLHAQGVPSGTVGWYNGDCQPGITSQSNWYISSTSYSVLFDDFVVPDGGWTIAGVFAHSQMTSTGVTEECRGSCCEREISGCRILAFG